MGNVLIDLPHVVIPGGLSSWWLNSELYWCVGGDDMYGNGVLRAMVRLY